MSTRVMRPEEWADPPPPVHREVVGVQPADPTNAAPVLFVPPFGHGAWVYAEHWLERTAERGFPAYAMSLRGHGNSGPAPKATLRAYAHDVTQVAAGLPRQAVLVGCGAGALVTAMALARYPARAAVLVSPLFRGLGALRSPGRRLFSRELPAGEAQGYVSRMGKASWRARQEVVFARSPEDPVGEPPVLVVGSPDDAVVSQKALDSVARRYGGAPLLFPGMGHDMMLDARWAEPIDAILAWLEKAAGRS